jgi:hypothetical protein
MGQKAPECHIYRLLVNRSVEHVLIAEVLRRKMKDIRWTLHEEETALGPNELPEVVEEEEKTAQDDDEEDEAEEGDEGEDETAVDGGEDDDSTKSLEKAIGDVSAASDGESSPGRPKGPKGLASLIMKYWNKLKQKRIEAEERKKNGEDVTDEGHADDEDAEALIEAA